MLTSQLPIALRMTKQRSMTLALTFRVYLFTIFSGHRPVHREYARTGLRSHARCHPYQVLQPVKVGHTTRVYDPYSFRIVMWVLFPQEQISESAVRRDLRFIVFIRED